MQNLRNLRVKRAGLGRKEIQLELERVFFFFFIYLDFVTFLLLSKVEPYLTFAFVFFWIFNLLDSSSIVSPSSESSPTFLARSSSLLEPFLYDFPSSVSP